MIASLPAALLLLGAMSAAPAFAADASGAPVPGVARALAEQRARDVSELRYELSLSIPAERAQPVTGTNVLRFRLADATRPLVIDFDPGGTPDAAVTANGVATEVRAVNGHLVIPPARLREGDNEIRIRFTAGDVPLNRGADLLYTLFVPARARQALPCFDQPDLKGRWRLTLEHPAAWQSVANGAEEARETTAARTVVRFAPTEPLPTYLVAFVAGVMKVETAERDGRTLRMFHREDDADKLARNRETLFDLHARSLAALQSYTAIPYPFAKFDFVLVPAFQFNGMEHAGNIVYNAEDLLLETNATQEQRLGRARLVAHETAHTWFGNLVTMRWFDDVWTKEVFANFIAAKVVDPLFPDIRHDLAFFIDHHGSAYAVDRSDGANPIRQPLENLDAAGSLYGPIIYSKSPVVMRQLESLLGEAGFRDSVRDYLRRHAFANATWDDLIAALAGRAKRDLVGWSRMWIDEPGRPRITTTGRARDGRAERLSLRQSDPRGGGRVWPQQLRVTVGCGPVRQRLVVDIDAAEVDLTARLGGCVPDYVLAGGEGWGYAEFELDERSLAHLSRHLHAIDEPLTRGVAWSALWDSMLAGRLAPERLYDTARLGLAHESETQLVAEWLHDLRTLWWRFLTVAQRQDRAAALETLLRHRLDQAASAGEKSTWFRGLRQLASTPETVAWLHALWRRDATIPGLPLVEPDEIALAHTLAVHGVADANLILETQLGRIGNPDRKARFAFVRAAASPDAAERERWFRALREPAARRHETWVGEGLSLLHHPLRSAASAALVPEGLALLLEVHRTGDLFFDASWLGATLGGHASAEVAAAVRTYLDGLPAGYPPRLRLLVLQTADPLFRAARARAR